jgi:hypothetical protein
MEGGRQELAQVEISEVVPPMPKEIRILRNIINELKIDILEKVTPQDPDQSTKELQDMEVVDKAIATLQRLSNILTAVISESKDFDYQTHMGDVEIILKIFKEQDLDIDNIDDDTRELCLFYVNNDLNHATFDTNEKNKLV